MKLSLMTIFLLYLGLLLIPYPALAEDIFSEKTADIFSKISLTEDQELGIRRAIKIENSQAEKDRELYKNDALNLIQTARLRRERLNNDIELILDDTQKSEFEKIFSLDRLEWELFSLKEGLLLDSAQTNSAEYILWKLQQEYGNLMPENMMPGDGIPPAKPEGSGARIGSGSAMPGIRMRRSGFSSFMAGRIKEREAKKDHRIMKILTAEQLKLYKQLQKERKKQIKALLKQMKKRFTG